MTTPCNRFRLQEWRVRSTVRRSESVQQAIVWPKLTVTSLSRDSTTRAIAVVDPFWTFALRPDADRPFMEEISHAMSSSVAENGNGDE
jgi:hypothetical protein